MLSHLDCKHIHDIGSSVFRACIEEVLMRSLTCIENFTCVVRRSVTYAARDTVKTFIRGEY